MSKEKALTLLEEWLYYYGAEHRGTNIDAAKELYEFLIKNRITQENTRISNLANEMSADAMEVYERTGRV